MRHYRKFYDGGADGGAGSDQQQQQQQVQLPQGAFMADKYSAALPEDIRNDPFVTKNPNLEAAFRSAISAQKLIGKDPASLLEVPKPGDAAAFRNVMLRLGLPETADKYAIDDKAVPDTFKLNTEFGKTVVALAHKHGIPPQAFQGFYGEISAALHGANGQAEKLKATEKEQGYLNLQKQWGAAYDTKTSAARFGIAKLAGNDEQGNSLGGALMDKFIAAGFDADPMVMNFLAGVGELLAEDSDEGGGGGNVNFGTNSMTPEEARNKGREMTAAADREKDPAKRRQLNDEAQKYFKIATGGRMVGDRK